MANTNTTTAAKWVDQKWDRIDIAAYEEMIAAALYDQRQSPHGQLHVPYAANVSTGSIAAASMSSLSFTANTESEATLSPTTYYAAQEVEMALVVRAVQDPSGVLQQSLRSAIVQQVDVAALAIIANLTTNPVNAAGGFDKAAILQAIRLGATNAKQFWSPGKANPYCIVHVSNIDNILNQDSLTSAYVRGDRLNPVVSGWVQTAFGVDFYESGSVYTTGGVAYNVMAIKRALGIAYNQRPQVLIQEYQLTNRIICWTDLAVGAIRDAYAVQITSPVN